MKCHFCAKKDVLKKLEVLIKPHLNSDRIETVIVELCNHCIKRIKGETE